MSQSLVFFDYVFNKSPLIQCIVNNEGKILEVNDSFCDFFDFLLDKNPHYLNDVFYDESLQALIASPYEYGESQNIYIAYPGEKYKTFEIKKTWMNRHTALFVFIEREIAESVFNDIKRNYEDLAMKEEELQHMVETLTIRNHELDRISNELKTRNFELDNFVYKASHDMRSPLMTTLGLIQLADMSKDESLARSYLPLIKERIQSLDKLVNTILDLANNQRKALQIKPIALDNIINHCIQTQSHAIYFKDIEFDVQIEPCLDLNSDEEKLKIILNNLIGNAIKYQRKAVTKKKVTITASKAGNNKIFISIEDNGIGVIHTDLEKVFDMFYRGNDICKGSGLGLYIVKQAVEKINGDIHLESVYGEGTKVTVILPDIVVKKKVLTQQINERQ